MNFDQKRYQQQQKYNKTCICEHAQKWDKSKLRRAHVKGHLLFLENTKEITNGDAFFIITINWQHIKLWYIYV